ncbi:cyclase family protein [Streptomyces sp. NBC_01537]|uniref:cyclase family protein n=1 Tax=Streptomyces sp. NBC_01537 TaxID=2903896 RepID=UPI00386356A5
MTEYRASFDADVSFLNGGGLQTQGFRLDLPGPSLPEEELARLFVAHLGLLMVDRVRLSNVEVFAEAHKGSRSGPAEADAATGEGRRLIDLSHAIEAGMVTYPGLPGPEVTPHLTYADSRNLYAEGTEFTIGRITMVSNTGTYVDSPFHRYEGGVDLAGLPLESVADLPVVVVRLTGASERGVGAQTLAPYDVAGKAVLLHTGWDRHWRTEAYGVAAPYLAEDGAKYLADAGARLVGIDSVNIDSTDGGQRPAHSILLGAGIPVLEHLTNLGELPVHGARLHAAPAPVRDFGTFPVRAYALVPR